MPSRPRFLELRTSSKDTSEGLCPQSLTRLPQNLGTVLQETGERRLLGEAP